MLTHPALDILLLCVSRAGAKVVIDLPLHNVGIVRQTQQCCRLNHFKQDFCVLLLLLRIIIMTVARLTKCRGHQWHEPGCSSADGDE